MYLIALVANTLYMSNEERINNEDISAFNINEIISAFNINEDIINISNDYHKMLVNIIVACSNFYAFKHINKFNRYSVNILFLSALTASFLMHISETKHNLPGVYPFNLYTNLFLWADRTIAILCMFLGLIKCLRDHRLIKIKGSEFLLGLIMLCISENVQMDKYNILFSITHCIWHFCAYDCLSVISLNNEK